MRATLLLSFLLGTQVVLAQAPSFQWAGTMPNVSTPGQLGYVLDLDVAPDGSAYVTGRVNGPRAIVGDNIVGGGYLARYDTSGACLWAKTSYGTRIAANGSNGAYAVGTFSGSMDFAGTTMTASGLDAFVAKYDANGQELWARQMGGALDDVAFSVAIDGLGRVHVGGFFRGTGTFGGATLIATQDTTGFHATYDASGNFEWAVIAGGFNSNDGTAFLNTMTCDALGNTIMAGSFDDTGTFGSTTLTATAFDKLYLARFDVNGNCSWAHAMGATYGNEPRQVAITPSGNIYLYGGFWGANAVFGSTTLANANVSNQDIFLALFDANGSPQWARSVGSFFFNDFPASLDVDDAGNAWVAGSISFDALFGTLTLVGQGPFLAQYDETGTALLALRPTTADIARHALGTDGDHFICGNNHYAIFDMASGVQVGAALVQGDEGFLARYDEDLGYRWMRRMGLHGSAFDAASSVTTDAADNVYATGYFITTAILCGDTLRAPIGASHIWLNKRDPSGGCLWVEQIRCSEPLGMNQVNYPMSLQLDADGDLYLAGSFHGTIDFGVAQLVSAGKQDIFLAKYDANGNCLWAIREGGSEGDGATSVLIDPNGGIILVGSYAGNASIAGASLTSQGSSDGFLARYDDDGTASWVRSIGGASWDNTNDVAMDAQGHVYITGRYTTSANFGALTLNGTGDADLFVAKYDPNGDLAWVTGSTDGGWKQASSIVVGASGQVYITGQYNGSLTICTSTLTGDAANFHAFISCFDTTGALLWQQEFPATLGSSGASLATRPAGDIVLTGGFSGSMTVGSTTLNSVGGQDAWVASFNSAGDNLWAHAMSGTDFWDYTYGSDVTADEQNVHVVGSFGDVYFTAFDQTGGTCAFDPGDPGSVRFAPNSSDAFVAKYGSAEQISPPYNPLGCDGTVRIEEASSAAFDLVIAPNPVDHSFTLTSNTPFDARTRVVVRDALGREMNAPFTLQQGRIEVDAAALTSGAYTITLFTAQGQRALHLVKH